MGSNPHNPHRATLQVLILVLLYSSWSFGEAGVLLQSAQLLFDFFHVSGRWLVHRYLYVMILSFLMKYLSAFSCGLSSVLTTRVEHYLGVWNDRCESFL